MKKKNKKGLTVLIIGVVLLILSLFVNRYIEINDIYCITFMCISLIIEVYGLVRIIKDTY